MRKKDAVEEVEWSGVDWNERMEWSGLSKGKDLVLPAYRTIPKQQG